MIQVGTIHSLPLEQLYSMDESRIKLLSKIKEFFRPEIIPFDSETEKQKGKGFWYKKREYIHYSDLHHTQLAFHRFSGVQVIIIFLFIAILTYGFLINWHTTILVFVSALTSLYFLDLLFNFFLIFRSFSKPTDIKISHEEIEKISDNKWPTYTVLCPLYHEYKVLPQFINAMGNLDYPKEKLQVMLLLEEDDTETINEARNMNLPSFFTIEIIPHSNPKTKPKACNYGLTRANGEYTVIYDAEDIPDPLQLKKVVLAFGKANEKTICIQGKLNFYNPHQNLLTRIFTAEYSTWFELILVGLQSIGAPIPLGGTSNHFKTKDLLELKGWDPFNVTEDADLGMRLVKNGYITAIVDSETLEEATSSIFNWFPQRTRWIKGYIQTYFFHMRKPHHFIREWNKPHVITFQLIIGGKVLSMLINPFMFTLTVSYFLFRAHIGTFVESFFPTPILYMGVFSFIIGNFLYMYYYMIGCMKHDHPELVKFVIFVPFYWLLMSTATWIAIYKFMVKPHHWSKTKHGAHLNSGNLPYAHSLISHP